MTDGEIKLIRTTIQQDENGVPRKVEGPPKSCFCRIESVTRAEFFQGGRDGLNPELVFTVWNGDYDDETVLEYSGKRYAIYRTYHSDGDYVELYAERKGGTNEGLQGVG